MVLNKNWQVIFDTTAERQFSKLDTQVQKRIFEYLEGVIKLTNPKIKAVQLKGHTRSFWRYRVGDHRVIVRFDDDRFLIVAVKVAHRRHVYK
jgi:mRNA interferase RelE/StbE